MFAILKSRSAHSDRIERWLGTDIVEQISRAMAGGGPDKAPQWYGPPIAVAQVPGKVYVGRDGDFVGHVASGRASALLDTMVEKHRQLTRRLMRRNAGKLHAGFASLSDLIAEMTGGKRQETFFQKVGTTGVVGATNTLWFVGNQPAAGAAASAAPGGVAPTRTSTGALPMVNAAGGDTLHFITGYGHASVAAQTLLLYDRIFSVTKTMNSTSTEAVTGVPSRYQNTTDGNADSAAGNFLIIECRTALAATAHNWTTCLYTDQNGNGSATLPSVTGNSGNIINRLDEPTGQWFCPLASGDYGIKELDQMQCSAAVATGAIDFTIGHPIAFMPIPIASMYAILDGINSAVNLARIFDDACLALLELIKPATTATTYTGQFTLCSG